MLHTKLAAMKERSGLSKHQIAEKSGVPLSTVMRVFSGQTDSPTFHTVLALVHAMGGNLNELDDVQPPPELTAPTEPATPTPPPVEKLPDKMIEMYEKQITHRDKWIKTLFIVSSALMAVLIAILLIDILNGNIGYFRH